MDGILNNKYVLYGGAALLALVAGYALFGGSGSSEDSGVLDGSAYPVQLGGYGAAGVGSAASTGITADNSVELLANLEKTKSEYSFTSTMADIAATLQLGLASLSTQKDIAFDTNRSNNIMAGLDFSKTVLSQGNVQALVGGMNPNGPGGTVSFNFMKVLENPVRQSDGTVYNANTAILGGLGAYNASTGPGSTYAKGFAIGVPNLSGANYGLPSPAPSSVPMQPASTPSGSITGYASTAQSPYIPRVGAAPNTAYASSPPTSSPASIQPATGGGAVNPAVGRGTVSSPVAGTYKLSAADKNKY
jgi:hypothetical protein